jgi:hypothetical protein
MSDAALLSTEAAQAAAGGPILDAVPDPLDFRDRMFEPTLREVPQRKPLEDYLALNVPILDQGQEGACTGFGLATVVNYLMRVRRDQPDVCASPHMLYEMARRYDEWPGEDYSGSSARGAMKGWQRHGACEDRFWPAQPDTKNPLWTERFSDAGKRPLGAYYRVNHRDVVAMHTALAEVGILYATCSVHTGWRQVGEDGKILYQNDPIGGHAFAIVGFDEDGFWLQNSWGQGWGRAGFAQITYDDWLANATDVWVARLGAPIRTQTLRSVGAAFADSSRLSRAYAYPELRGHIVSLGNEGRLRPSGLYGTSEDDVRELFEHVLPAATKSWSTVRVLLIAHGGLVSEESAIQHLADYLAPMMDHEIYPISFIWHSDYWSTITNVLRDAVRRRRNEGVLDAAKDFLLDRLDDMLEPIARALTGKLEWDEMKENAECASTNGGGAAIIAGHLQQLLQNAENVEIHIVGHSAGAILHGRFAQLLSRMQLPIHTCTMWAPACTMKFADANYLPLIRSGAINDFALYTLTDDMERDDNCAHLYNKSLLYLVSDAFEDRLRVGREHGEPLLGMEKFVRAREDWMQELAGRWVLSSNGAADGTPQGCAAHEHGAFDDDQPTLHALMARVLGHNVEPADFVFHRSAASQRGIRSSLVGRSEYAEPFAD